MGISVGRTDLQRRKINGSPGDEVSSELKSAGQLLLLRHCCIGMQRADPSHFKSISFEIGQFANESRAEEDEGFCQRPPFTPQQCAALNAESHAGAEKKS